MKKPALLILGFKEKETQAEQLAKAILNTLFPLRHKIELLCLPEQGVGYKIYKKAPQYGFSLTAFHYRRGKFSKKVKHVVVETEGENWKIAAAVAKVKAAEQADVVLLVSPPPFGSSTRMALEECDKGKVVSLETLNGLRKVSLEDLKSIMEGKIYGEKEKVSSPTHKGRRTLPAFFGRSHQSL